MDDHFTHITLATEAQEIIADFSQIIETQVTKKIDSRASSENLFKPFLDRRVFRPHLHWIISLRCILACYLSIGWDGHLTINLIPLLTWRQIYRVILNWFSGRKWINCLKLFHFSHKNIYYFRNKKILTIANSWESPNYQQKERIEYDWILLKNNKRNNWSKKKDRCPSTI